jgi:hypothetical protein
MKASLTDLVAGVLHESENDLSRVISSPSESTS